MRYSPVSRRAFLNYTAVVGTTIMLPSLFSAPAWAVEDDPGTMAEIQAGMEVWGEGHRRPPTELNSRNGWEMEKVVDARGNIHLRPVPGTPLKGIHVRIGDVETTLVHLVRRFHYEIDQLRIGDVVGWHAPGTVRWSLPESNLASGTAIRIRPGHYPPGTRGNYFPLQLLVIRDVLAELDGVVRWGGDDRKVDESLFYLDVRPGDKRLPTLVNKIRGWQDQPGRGAGAPADVTSSTRRTAAAALERRQRKTMG